MTDPTPPAPPGSDQTDADPDRQTPRRLDAEAIWRNELRLWPHTIHQIDDTLDIELIEGRGKQLLFQSLTASSLTAFVGTGLSASYGRMGWNEWKAKQLSLVDTMSSAFIDLAQKTDAHLTQLAEQVTGEPAIGHANPASHPEAFDIRLGLRWVRHRQRVLRRALWDVKNLERTYRASKSDQGSFPGGEDNPVLLEIAQKLHDLLIATMGLFSQDDAPLSDPLRDETLPPRLRGRDKAYENIWQTLARRIKSSKSTAPNAALRNVLSAKQTKYFFGLSIRTEDGAPTKHLAGLVVAASRKKLIGNPVHISAMLALHHFLDLLRDPSAQLSFDAYAKTLLIDECPHARHLLETGLDYSAGMGRSGARGSTIDQALTELAQNPTRNLKRDLDGIRQAPEQYKVLGYFRRTKLEEKLQDLPDSVPQNWQDLIGRIMRSRVLPAADENKRAVMDHGPNFLTPTSRFLVPVYLRLLPDPGAALQGLFQDVTPQDFLSRRSILSRDLDPMNSISEKLGITRYLTTNYDFEIERFFQDKGYHRFDPHKALPNGRSAADDAMQFRTDGMGGVMRDLTFKSETATDLLAFAAGGGAADMSVFHLHGRATSSDGIVATEREYMNLYLRSEPDREVIDESILMAFSANPILFLGLGMTEADVLRPMRQFMSDQDRAIGYRGIVLLPADQSFDQRVKTSAGLYMRYGAHTIFYGGGVVECPDESTAKIDWLHRMMRLVGLLKEAAEKRLQEVETKDPPLDENAAREKLSDPLISARALCDKMGDLGAELLHPGQDTSLHPALAYLLGLDPGEIALLCKDVDDASDKDDEDALSSAHQALTDALHGPDPTQPTRLQNCTFTTHRSLDSAEAASKRTIELDSTPYTGIYVDLLSELMHLALADAAYVDADQGRRSLNAMVTALGGIKGALHSGAFNASLSFLHDEWRRWWKDWQTSPPQREPRFEFLTDAPAPDPEEQARHRALLAPRREVRHKVESVITDLRHVADKTAPEIDKTTLCHKDQTALPPDYQTGVRIFDRFIYDIARAARFRKPTGGRVVTTVAADRGHGKGVLFSTLTTRIGLTSYIRAVHGEALADDKTINPGFVAANFINLSFATEMASAYDMLFDSLTRSVAQLRAVLHPVKRAELNFGADAKAEFETFLYTDERRLSVHYDRTDRYRDITFDVRKDLIKEMQGLSRLERLRHLLAAFGTAAEQFATDQPFGLAYKPRLLICINAAELLFDTARQTKNREIADFLEWLASDAVADLPFDLLTIGVLDKLGHFWASDHLLKRVSFNWTELPAESQAEFARRAQQAEILSIAAGGKVPSAGISGLLPGRAAETNLVHFARRARATQFLVDNFPVLALALLVARYDRQAALKDVIGGEPGPLGEARSRINAAVRAAVLAQKAARDAEWYSAQPPDVNEAYLRTREDLNWAICTAVLAEALPKLRDRFDPDLQNMTQLSRGLVQVFEPPDNTADARDWTELDTVLSGNRFCLTVLLAAAEQLLFTEYDFVQGGMLANRMLEQVVSALRSASVGLLEETVMNTVMSVNRQVSRIGDPDLHHDFHQLLLRNLAVLGCPTSPNILVRLPDIRAYFSQIAVDTGLSRRRMVARALAAMAERGLVFRVSPHPKLLRIKDAVDNHATDQKLYRHEIDMKAELAEWPAEHEYRYALHRQLQTYCFKRLGHLTAPPVTANSFAPTLYAAMPSRVIRLSTEGYLFLRRLLLGLSQYPDIRHEDAARAMPIFGEDDVITRVQALRAGLSVARNCFSIASISRFDKDMTGLSFIRRRGHFETYRVRLRWILRKAWEVHEPREDAPPEDIDRRRVNALYLDEIIWLYNEVAVTCLVQGSLADGIGNIRQAIKLNEMVEGGSESGRMHNMLALNAGIIQLERGRLGPAEVRLNQILDTEGDTQHRVAYIARGYLAVIAQLRGHHSEAEAGLLRAVKDLETDRQDRALAIMLHHLARLMAKSNPEQAMEHLIRARNYAEKGGHEDIRYRILVTEVGISQNHTDTPQDRMSADRSKLRDAENYASVMGLHALMVECLHSQGMMLLNAGDYSSSGRMMTKAMAIARRHDMTLRLNSAMTSYAQVLLARRRIASAKRLLGAALSMAKRSGYSLEVGRIHAVMEQAERQTTAAETP